MPYWTHERLYFRAIIKYEEFKFLDMKNEKVDMKYENSNVPIMKILN